MKKFRNEIKEQVIREIGELSDLDKTVLESVTEKTTISDKVEFDSDENRTFGQRVADNVASFGGSWKFIIFFGFFIFVWILANIYWLRNQGFDPYPFILLNLILSCLAALQAPVIMMSQNRQEEKDRDRAKKDYMVNLKAEVEIRILHEKLDHLISHQQQEILDIQKVQIQMLEHITKEVGNKLQS